MFMWSSVLSKLPRCDDGGEGERSGRGVKRVEESVEKKELNIT